MKRVIGLISLFLGALFIVLAPMLRFYVVPNAAKAPLDTDSRTYTTGTVSLVDIAGIAAGEIKVREDLPFNGVRNTVGDVTAAEASDAKSQDLAIYDTFSCNAVGETPCTDLPETSKDIFNASTARFAFNRVTSELSDCCGAALDGKAPATPMSGIMPLKFPFFVEQKSYDVYDTALQKPVPWEYVGEENKYGVNTYHFATDVPPTKVTEIAGVPGKLAGKPGSVTVEVQYANKSNLWIDPVTGQIVDGDSDIRQIAVVDGQEVVDIAHIKGGSDPQYLQSGADDIKATADQLNMLKNTAPIGLGILGLVLGGLGLALTRKKDDGSSAATPAPATAGAPAAAAGGAAAATAAPAAQTSAPAAPAATTASDAAAKAQDAAGDTAAKAQDAAGDAAAKAKDAANDAISKAQDAAGDIKGPGTDTPGSAS